MICWILVALICLGCEVWAEPPREQQMALQKLGETPTAEAKAELGRQLDALEAGTLPLALWLEVLEAAERSGDAALKQRLAARAGELAKSPDPMQAWRDCLEGGDANAGRLIFEKRLEAGCVRCHRAERKGGEIGPDLSSLPQRAQRISVLESILEPNTYIVPGFQHVLLKLKDGKEISGILSFEGSDLLQITTVVDGKRKTIPVSEVEKETALPSAMPPGYGTILGRRAIRDLVEFLSTQE